MTRTKRIYNKLRLKKTPRYDLEDGSIHIVHGIPYTWRSWICMGKCPFCRDPKREPDITRKRMKEEMRRDWKSESKNTGG